MLDGLEEQINANHSKILSAGDLRKFANLFRNKLQLSDPRSCVVEDIAKDTDALSRRLVSDQIQHKAHPKGLTAQQIRAQFRDMLETHDLYSLMQHDIEIPAYYRPGKYKFAHGYQNGLYHVIHEEGFAVSDPDDNVQRAFALATEIEDARRQRQDADFTIIASFANDQPEVEKSVGRLFHDKKITLRTPERLKAVIEKVSEDLARHRVSEA
jgi:hypothetical protein